MADGPGLLSVVLSLLLRQEEARAARLRLGPPPREGPTEEDPSILAPAHAARPEATETETASPGPGLALP